jgi:hypothetical protein
MGNLLDWLERPMPDKVQRAAGWAAIAYFLLPILGMILLVVCVSAMCGLLFLLL